MANLERKQAAVEEVRDRMQRAVATVLVDFRGLAVPTVTELRDQFRAVGVEYKVVKNNLVRKALEGTDLQGNEALKGFLTGPTAIAWSYEDPSAAAKVIKKFRKEGGDEAEKLTVKCGLLDNEVLEGERVERELASLPGKDEIRAQLLAQLLAPGQSLVRQLAAPGQNLAYAFDARRSQLEDG